MPGPIPHHLAPGIHPGAFVQASAPDTADVQDGVLWIDSSAGPPYVYRVWRAGASRWDVVQMDATGYPLPHHNRLEEYVTNQTPNPSDAPVLGTTHAFSNPFPAGTYTLGYTYLATDGETALSPTATITVDGTQWITLTTSAPPSDIGPHFLFGISVYVVEPLPLGVVGVYTGYVSDYPVDTTVNVSNDTAPDASQPPAANQTGTWQVRVVDPHATALLDLPLPVLGATPATLVGQDPDTLLPAYCPAPSALPATGWKTPPVPPPLPAALVTTRCGAAVAMADKLERIYANVSSWLNGLESLVAGLLLNAVMDLVIEAITDGGATPWLITNQGAVKTVASFIILHAVGSDFPTLNSAQDADILSSAFCALPTDVSNLVMTDAIISDWQTRLSAFSADFPGPGFNLDVLGLLIGCVSTDAWQQAAYQGAAAPSAACAGIVCP